MFCKQAFPVPRDILRVTFFCDYILFAIGYVHVDRSFADSHL